ncbi:hypothetical protein [Reyranella sp.]|uniref:hypothetical protein n=1 Tax=Reyranella sp. TaxID=1929291 RepID=UPI003BA88130
MTEQDKSKVETNFHKNKALIYSIQNKAYLASKKNKGKAKSPESAQSANRRRY